ncbi:MAG: hypothetical protein AAGH78_05710 [Cyanobacteria bacterium P01_H01_bin.58]
MPQPSTFSSPPWFSVPESAKALLTAAAQSWEDSSTSERYVQEALTQPNVALEVLESAYRYYFYKNNDVKALAIARAVMERICTAEQWHQPWEALVPILSARLDESATRLYLNAYTASGLLLARLGQLGEAEVIAQQVAQLGAPEFGADVLLSVLQASPDEEDEDD